MKIRFGKTSIAVMVSLSSVLTLAPMTTAQAASQPVTITFWDRHPELKTLMTSLVQKFEKTHPDIKVNFQEVPVSQETQQYEAAVSSNSLPDVFSLAGYTLPQFVSFGQLKSLNSIFTPKVQKSFVPGTFSEGYATMGKNVYQLPIYSPYHSSFLLFYNKQVLKKYGIGVRPPKTWSQLLSMGKEIYQKSNGKVYGLSIGAAQNFSWTLYTAISQMATAISPDANGGGNNVGMDFKTGQFDFSTPGIVGGVNFFKTMMTDHVLDPNSLNMSQLQAQAAFASGKAAFFMQGDWGGIDLNQLGFGQFGVAPLPTKNGKPSYGGYIGINPEGFAVSAHTKHWTQDKIFLKFLLNNMYSGIADQGLDPARDVSVRRPQFPQARSILGIIRKNAVLLPNVYQRNPATINVMVNFSNNQPKEDIGIITQGYLTGQVTNVSSALTQLSAQYNQVLANAIKGSKGAVTQKDFEFPNWVPFKPYTSADYKKLK